MIAWPARRSAIAATRTLQVAATANPGAPITLGVGMGITPYMFSPAGGKLGFVLEDGNKSLYIWNPSQGATPSQIVVPSGTYYDITAFWFSPDGSELVYLEGSNLYVTSSVGSGNPRYIGSQLDAPDGETSDAVVFSADGSHIAFANGSSLDDLLNVVRVDGAGTRVSMEMGPWSPFAFSPDGSRIAFMSRASSGSDFYETLNVARTEGLPSTINLLDHARYGTAAWLGANQILAARVHDPPAPPYDFQDGVYRFDVPRAAP